MADDDQNNNSIKPPALLITFLIFVSISSAFLISFLLYSKRSFQDFMHVVVNRWYFLDVIISQYPAPFINYVYLGILLLTVCLGFFICKKKIELQKLLNFSCIFVFILSLSFQTIHQAKRFQKEIKLVSNKTLSERIGLNSRFIYPFSRYSQTYVKGIKNCSIDSDMELVNEANLGNYVLLRYYLYPIDIHFNRSEEKDCVVLYHKKDALKFIPENFVAMPVFNNNNLIAVRDLQK